jgi:hypothetical protein
VKPQYFIKDMVMASNAASQLLQKVQEIIWKIPIVADLDTVGITDAFKEIRELPPLMTSLNRLHEMTKGNRANLLAY